MYRFDQVATATTPAVLAAVAAAHPDRAFVIASDGDLTYGAAARRAVRLAAQFGALGLHSGDRVGILLPNGSRWCTALLGAHAAGLSVVPLNTWYREDELLAVARRARLRVIVTQSEIFGFDSGPRAAWVGGQLDPADFRGTFAWPHGTAGPDGLPAVPEPSTRDALQALYQAPASESDDALLLFTSGSSAEPKAVRLAQGGLVRTAYAIGERQGIRASDRFWFASPLFFVFGCSNALPNTLTHAATLCLQERFEAGPALEFIERHRCTVYYGVAPVTRALAACEDLAKRDISSLRAGTANATPEDLRLAIEVLGVDQVCNAYGLTEGYGHSTITACTDPVSVRMSSQGHVLPTQELRIVTGGAVAAPGEAGEIQIRGTITPGYFDSPGLTATAFDDAGWFRTGDIGRLDGDGRLHYVGRSSEMMKVKGISISPAEVEQLLVRHELVDEAFVFGLATPEGDESVGCVLVSTVAESAREALVRDVQEWMRQRAAAYKVPSEVRVVMAGQLPLTPTGKVSRRLLREQSQA